jgi:3-hydroxyacyl-[acyl-carrier-protein] dehydratase
MRFIFVDRVLALDPGRSIDVVKNVSASEDFFEDHFPGRPIFPGALMVEVFEQAAQILIGATHGWTSLGRLRTVSGCSFRQLVRPGDRIVARCERRDPAGPWRLRATASVEGRVVATATLELELEPVQPGTDAPARARRLEALARTAGPRADLLAALP